MLVRNRMTQKVITVEPECPLDAARGLMQRHRIRQIPVTRKQRLAGIVTDRDLRGAGAKATTVADVMTPKPIVIGPNASVDEAARVLITHKIGALPVIEGNKLIGILASVDVLAAFVELSGVGEATYRIQLSGAKGKQGEQQVREVVANGHGELKWIHRDTDDPNTLHLRLKSRRIDDIVTALEAAGFDVSSLIAPAAARPA